MTRTDRKTPGSNRLGMIAGVTAATVAMAVANAIAQRRAERANPPQGRVYDVDGERVHVVERGEGSPIVLVHGNATLAQDWLASGVVERLAARHRVIIVERPGFGWSTRSRRTAWTPFAQARLLRATLDRIGVARATIVGHSWGTLVALAHALDHPEATAAIGLLSGYYFLTERIDTLLLGGPAVPGTGDVMRYTISPPLGRALVPLMFKQIFAPAAVPDRFREGMPVAMLVRASQIRATAADNLRMQPGAYALSRRYGELAPTLPTLLLTGEGDRVVAPARQTHALSRALPWAELVTLPGVGHMVQHSAPDTVADAILRLAARAA